MSISDTARDTICCEILRQYLFDHVWNEPESEYRINVHPQLYREKSVVGSFRVLDANIKLPTDADQYYIWYMKSTDINLGLELEPSTWYNTAIICNEHRTLIHTYTESGSMLPKCSVFIRYNRSKSIVYIAINKHAFKLMTPKAKLTDLYLTFYYDSDVVNDIKIYSFYTDSVRKFNEINLNIRNLLFTANSRDCITEFKNGEEITDPDNSPILEFGNYYDIVVDNNVIFSFDVDLTSHDECPVFLSSMDKVWKQIIHIPRHLNPDNEIITHNTCDLFVRIKGTNHGKYLHRATTGRTVGQITHNDLSIPLFILDAYRDYLGNQNITIHGVARRHDKDNRLIRDSNYIDLLYNEAHSDEDIVKFLSNENNTKMTFWKADVLESSKYVKMMFDSPNGVSLNNVSECIDALGYFSTVNLLCKRTIDAVITKSYDGELKFNLSLMYLNSDVIPVIYINGKELRFKYYTYSTDKSKNTCSVYINKDVYLPVGTKITAMFFVTDDNRVYTFTPSAEALSFTVPYSTPVVYRKYKLDKNVDGINKSSNESYEELGVGNNIYIANEVADGTKLTFNATMIGTEFIIQNKASSYVRTYNLSEYTKTGKTIAIPIDTNPDIPLFSIKNILVFMNGKYLVKNIDYFINIVRDSVNRFSFAELVIQTMDNFNENGDDSVDVIYSVANTEEESSGFSVNNILADATPVNLFFDNITSTHVNGLLERNGEYHGTYVKIPENKYPEGSIFEIQTAVPYLVTEFLKRYSHDADFEKINILNEYFNQSINLAPDTLLLENKHRIYSVFMNNFIQDILNGKVQVVDDPDTQRFTNIIKPYLYLQKMDLCFKNIDGNFIDRYPQYVNYPIDAATKHFIDRFITSLMPDNTNPTMEVVYGG